MMVILKNTIKIQNTIMRQYILAINAANILGAAALISSSFTFSGVCVILLSPILNAVAQVMVVLIIGLFLR